MLKIAVISPNYVSGKNFIEAKFRDKISKINRVKGTWTLENGDEIYNCSGEPDKWRGMNFDAYVEMYWHKQSITGVIAVEELREMIRARSNRIGV